MEYSVYIMTNLKNSVLYVGVTNNLLRRVYQHKSKKIASFTKKYNLIKLVYYEVGEEILEMIEREKQILNGEIYIMGCYNMNFDSLLNK